MPAGATAGLYLRLRLGGEGERSGKGVEWGESLKEYSAFEEIVAAWVTKDPGHEKHIMPWWLIPDFTRRWSEEELWSWKAIHLFTLATFLLLYVPVIWLGNHAIRDERTVAVVALVVCAPAASRLSRRLCAWLWPVTLRLCAEGPQ